MKGKIRGYTGQIGFYKVPEEMKNSLTYTSPFIDLFKEITDFKFHTYPPQDVYYHPIENRVDTTPITFYYKVSLYSSPNLQNPIYDSGWKTTNLSVQNPYRSAKIELFHPLSNIRQIKIEHRYLAGPNNELPIETIELSYNSQHLYSFNFNIDDVSNPEDKLVRVFHIYAKRWEDTNYIHLYTIKLTSSIIYSRILYSLVQGETPTLLGVDWTSYGGSYTFGWVDAKLELKFADFEGVKAIVNNTLFDHSPSFLSLSSVRIFPVFPIPLNISNNDNTFSKQIFLTSDALIVNNPADLKWYGKDISITHTPQISFPFYEAPSLSPYWKLGINNNPNNLKEIYMTVGSSPNNTRTRKVLLYSSNIAFSIVNDNIEEIIGIVGETTKDGIPVFLVNYHPSSSAFSYEIKKGNINGNYDTYYGTCFLLSYTGRWLPSDDNKILYVYFNGIDIGCYFIISDVEFSLYTPERKYFGKYTWNWEQQSGYFSQAYIEKI